MKRGCVLHLTHIVHTAERAGGDARSSVKSAMFIVTDRRGGHAKLRRSGMNGTLSPTQLAAIFEQRRTNAAPTELGGPCGTCVYKHVPLTEFGPAPPRSEERRV